jgi:plastocyanin
MALRPRLAAGLGAAALLAALFPLTPVVLAATITIQLEPVSGNRLFVPQNAGSINQGDTITWQNVNGTHDVTSASIPAGATAFASPVLSGAATFTRTFSVAGSYRYFCSIHASAADANAGTQDPSKMVGQFTVVADTTAPNAPTGLGATPAGGSQINLAWTPSTSTDVVTQELFRNTVNTRGTATLIASFGNNTTAAYGDAGLTAATPFFYWLEAIDGAANRSAPATATAATTSVNAQVTAQQAVLFDISTTLQLSVTPATIDLGSVSPAAAAATAIGATVANVKSNAGWSLGVKSIGTNGVDDSPGDDGVFTSGSNTVPVSRLGWRINPSAGVAGSAAYAALSDTNASIATSATATSAAGTDTFLQYELQTLFSDPVGLDFRTVLLFTATSP